MEKIVLALTLLGLSAVTIFSFTWTDGSVRIDHYIYSSQAALFSTQNVLYPSDPKLQDDFELKDHPLLFRWMVAGVYKIFGISEYTSKVLSGLMGCLLVLMIFLFGSHFFSKWVGFFSALFLLISPRFMVHASLCLLDIPLIFFTTSAIFLGIYASQNHSRFYILSGVCTGLALLTKGPFGLLPLLVIGFYVVIFHPRHLKSSRLWAALLMPLILISIYTMIVSAADPNASYFSFWRTVGVGPYEDKPFFYITALFTRYVYLIIPVLILGYSALLRLGHSALLRSGVSTRFLSLGSTQFKPFTPLQKSIVITTLFWCVAVIGPLSFAVSKKQAYYLLPLNPALSLLCGIVLDWLIKENIKKMASYATLIITCGLAFIFSSTPLILFKSKTLRDQSHYKQYADLKWGIENIIRNDSPLYYEHGLNYVLNFHFSRDYAHGRFQEINDSLFSEMKHSPVQKFLIVTKLFFRGNLSGLFIVHETRDLFILSNQPKQYPIKL